MSLRKWIVFALIFSTLTGCGSGDWSSGDRVLVAKGAFDMGISGPNRYDVVVFKYPVTPVLRGVPRNYIKRLLGLPGELLAIFFGRVYRLVQPEGAPPPYNDSDVARTDLWHKELMHQ